MTRRLGCLLLGILVLIILGVLMIVLFVESGSYNVAADYPDSGPAVWLFSTTLDKSVRRHARGVKPPDLSDPAMAEAGARNYKDDCVICHGAPGVRPGELARALNPRPPDLTKTANDWKPRELFWITKHGIRMTGMPAWGLIDQDDELWQTVAFVKRLPKMSPSEYREMTRPAKAP